MSDILTIDLDYWTNHFKNPNYVGACFIKKCIQEVKDVWVIRHHHHILDLIPNNISKLINIDFHNDIIGDDCEELNEGTWGNFLPTSIKKFEWYYPNYNRCVLMQEGICHSDYGVVKRDYPIDYSEILGYKNADLSKVKRIVFCLSPEWATEHPLDSYLNIIGINEDCQKPTKIFRKI